MEINMSDSDDKIKKATRRFNDETKVKKQVKIAKAHGLTDKDKIIKEPNRLAKHHAMDCGNPECYVCGNPRKTHKDKLTAQEKRIFQDVEKISDKHSNGLVPDEE
jgi:DNA repair exonuclease SbcCD ATPase subunit